MNLDIDRVIELFFPHTLPPAYLSCEFAFRVRFQRIVRALSFICV